MGYEDKKREALYGLDKKMTQVMAKIQEAQTTEQNKKTLKRFKIHLLAKHLSVHRVLIYLQRARKIAETLPDKKFEDYTQEDVNFVMVTLRPNYANATMNLFYLTFKVLFRYIEGLGNDEQSEKTKHLKEFKTGSHLKKEDIVTQDDMNKILAGCTKIKPNGFMYSVMLSIQWEISARPSEIRGLLVGSVEKLENGGYSLAIDALKTDNERFGYVVVSAPQLERWINEHPQKDNPEAPLFFFLKDGQCKFVKHHTYLRTMYRLTEKVLGKRKPLYNTRHGRITNMLVDHRTPLPLIKRIVGHSPTSNTIVKTYLKFDNFDTQNEMNRLAGMNTEQKPTENNFVTRICPKCKNTVASYEVLCSKCGYMVNENGVAIRKETPRINFETLTDEERNYMRDFMRDELKRMLQEQQQTNGVNV